MLVLLKCQMYIHSRIPSRVHLSVVAITFHIREKRCLLITLSDLHLHSMHLLRHAHGLFISTLLSTFLGQVQSQRYLAEDDDRLTRFVTVCRIEGNNYSAITR